MSANACVAFLGVRIEVEPDAIGALEERSDPRLSAARKAGLNTYWAKFGGASERYLLFVGRRLAVLGSEDQQSSTISVDYFSEVLADTRKRLHDGGFAGEPKLHLEWLEDA